MKVKLLKKIRKRYYIEFHPKGCQMGSTFEKNPMMVLVDRESQWRTHRIYNVTNERQMYHFLLDELNKWIREDYIEYGTRRNNKKTGVLLWFKSKTK